MADQPEPKPKPRENKLLIFIAVAFVCLYVVLTAYVILTNKTIGSTQLGYSAVHKQQLNLLQEEVARLTGALTLFRREQEGATTLNTVRFDGVESRINHLSKELEIAETSRQTLAKTSTAQLDTLRQQVTELSGALGALKAEQGQLSGAMSTRLGEVQSRLEALTNTLGSIQAQQAQATAALVAQLSQVQKETIQIASSKASLDQLQFLGGLLDAAMGQSAAWQQLPEETLPQAAQWWRQTQLLVGAAQAEPALAEKTKQVHAESERVRQLIAKSIPDALKRHHDTALKAAGKDEALAAWAEAGEILALFPVTPESASDTAVRDLAAEHENVRQQLQARK